MDSDPSSSSYETVVTPQQETGGASAGNATPDRSRSNHMTTPTPIDSLETNTDFILLKNHVKEVQSSEAGGIAMEESKLIM